MGKIGSLILWEPRASEPWEPLWYPPGILSCLWQLLPNTGAFCACFLHFCLFSVRRFVASNRFRIHRQTLWQAREGEGEGGGKKDGYVVGCSYLLVFPASCSHLHFPLMCRGDLWGAIWRLGTHNTDMQIDFFALGRLFIYFSVALSFHESRCLLAPCR